MATQGVPALTRSLPDRRSLDPHRAAQSDETGLTGPAYRSDRLVQWRCKVRPCSLHAPVLSCVCPERCQHIFYQETLRLCMFLVCKLCNHMSLLMLYNIRPKLVQLFTVDLWLMIPSYMTFRRDWQQRNWGHSRINTYIDTDSIWLEYIYTG